MGVKDRVIEVSIDPDRAFPPSGAAALVGARAQLTALAERIGIAPAYLLFGWALTVRYRNRPDHAYGDVESFVQALVADPDAALIVPVSDFYVFLDKASPYTLLGEQVSAEQFHTWNGRLRAWAARERNTAVPGAVPGTVTAPVASVAVPLAPAVPAPASVPVSVPVAAQPAAPQPEPAPVAPVTAPEPVTVAAPAPVVAPEPLARAVPAPVVESSAREQQAPTNEPIAPALSFCPSCGTRLVPDALFCPACGADLRKWAPPAADPADAAVDGSALAGGVPAPVSPAAPEPTPAPAVVAVPGSPLRSTSVSDPVPAVASVPVPAPAVAPMPSAAPEPEPAPAPTPEPAPTARVPELAVTPGPKPAPAPAPIAPEHAPVRASVHTPAAPVSMAFCPACGAHLRPGARFCNHCGADLVALAPPTEEELASHAPEAVPASAACAPQTAAPGTSAPVSRSGSSSLPAAMPKSAPAPVPASSNEPVAERLHAATAPSSKVVSERLHASSPSSNASSFTFSDYIHSNAGGWFSLIFGIVFIGASLYFIPQLGWASLGGMLYGAYLLFPTKRKLFYW